MENDEATLLKFNVGKELVDSFVNDAVRLEEVTEAEEIFQNINFDEYSEKAHCQILTGIYLKDLRTIVTSLTRRFDLTHELSESILDAEFAAQNDKVVREFHFKRGESGHVRYGRVATIKRDRFIDLAYSIYVLDFKFSANTNDSLSAASLSWMFPNINVERGEARRMSCDEKNKFQQLVRHKAMTSFRQEYPMVDKKRVNSEWSFNEYSSDGLVVCCCAFM